MKLAWFYGCAILSLLCVVATSSADPTTPAPAGGGELPPGVKDLTPANWPAKTATCAIPEDAEEHGHAGFYTVAEYLLLRARRPDQRFVLVDPTDDLMPNGSTRTLSPETRSGFRVQLGYRLPSEWEVGASFMYYRTGDIDSAMAPAAGTLYPMFTRPGLINNVRQANADTMLDYMTYDLRFGRSLHADEHLQLRLFGGVEFASIAANQRAFYQGTDANFAFAGMASEFDGAGPMLGGEGYWTIGHGLSLFGRGRVGLLYGDQQTTALETNDAGSTINTNFTDRFQQVVPMMHLGLGLSYQYRGVRISGGYEVTNWFGLVQSPYITDDFSEGKIQYRGSDLALEGFFLQLGFDY